MAKQKAVEINNISKDKNIHITLMMKIMKVTFCVVFLHGAEGWTIKKSSGKWDV